MHREVRLKKDQDFTKVYRSGKSTGNKYLVLYYLLKDSRGPTQVGFSISNKVGKAVVRNKLKRRLRGIMASLRVNIKDGYMLVFVVKQGTDRLEYERLKELTSDLLKKGAIIEG